MPRTSSTTACDATLTTGYHAPRRKRHRSSSRIRAQRGAFPTSARSSIDRSIRSPPARAACAVAYMPRGEGRQEDRSVGRATKRAALPDSEKERRRKEGVRKERSG